MATESAPFAALLKRFRLAAGLSQEGLAEQAALSPSAVSALERGVNRKPYLETVRLLADALSLNSDQRTILLAAARPELTASLETADSVADDAAPGPDGPARGAGRDMTDDTEEAPARHNLPVALSHFLGRTEDQVRLFELLEGARLVTLTGPGGVGKTRLALKVAEALLPSCPDGVWLVELAALTDPASAPGAVAAALSIREEPGVPIPTTLAKRLRSKQLLLVLDNCEHLIDTCATIAAALLRVCPDVRILATSREGLDVSGERLYQVPPLSVPDLRRTQSPDPVGSYEGVRLFVARARDRRPDFALTTENERAVAEICVRLDGIPLAIELAAARVGSLEPAVIAARLDDRFALSAWGARTALPHQRTLRGALDWSWDLLNEPERILLRRLSVFAGGWTLDAAEAVCVGQGVADRDVADLLDGLVGKSLVQVERAPTAGDSRETRYRLLETVRQYGWELLIASVDLATVRRAHAVHYLALAAEAESKLVGAEQGRWLARLETEHDNLRAALTWAMVGDVSSVPSVPGGPAVEQASVIGRSEVGLRLVAALYRFWDLRGHLSEGWEWTRQALDRADTVAPEVRAQALLWAGILLWRLGNHDRARPLFEQGLQAQRHLGDRSGVAQSLNNLGIAALSRGRFDEARAYFEESLDLRRELGDKPGLAGLFDNLGLIALDQGRLRSGPAGLEQCLQLRRELQDQIGIISVLTNLGLVARFQGDYGQARSLYEQSLLLVRALGDQPAIGTLLNNLGILARLRGDHAQSWIFHEEGLRLLRQMGDRYLGAELLGNVGQLLVAQGHLRRAALLLSASDARRTVTDAPRRAQEQVEHDQAVVEADAALGAADFAAAWAAGQVMTVEEAIDLALSPLDEAAAP